MERINSVNSFSTAASASSTEILARVSSCSRRWSSRTRDVKRIRSSSVQEDLRCKRSLTARWDVERRATASSCRSFAVRAACRVVSIWASVLKGRG